MNERNSHLDEMACQLRPRIDVSMHWGHRIRDRLHRARHRLWPVARWMRRARRAPRARSRPLAL